MNRSKAIVIVALAALSLPCPAEAAESLGRLFMTPERRALLERQRQLNIQEARTLQGATMRLDGIVRRSSGKTTVWINGQAEHDRSRSAGVEARFPGRDSARAILQTGDEAPAELRVGEAVNRGTRETRDLLGGGVISREAAKGN